MTRTRLLPALALCLAFALPAPAALALPIEKLPGLDELPIIHQPKAPDVGPDVIPVCSAVGHASYAAGGMDNFAGAEATSQSPDFDAWLGSRPQRGFDEGGADKAFGHTFSGLPSKLLSGTLQMRVRDEDSLASNDGIALQFNGATFWWASTVGAVAATDPSNSVWPGTVLLTLDLAALPGAGKVNLLDEIGAAGYLDVYVQDDTNVDWISLSITYCLCPGGSVHYIEQGTQDNFQGPEGPTPRAALDAWGPASRRAYDDASVNTHFLTTIWVPDVPCLVGAVLEIRVKSEGDVSSNDYLWLQLVDDAEGAGVFEYGQPIGSPVILHDVVAVVENILAQVLPQSAAIPLDGPKTVTVDLAKVGLMHDLARKGYLDVYVQDDHNVDYVALTLTYA